MRLFLIFITAGLILLSSCKKKDDITYSPVNQKDSTGMPPLFPDTKLQMMSDYEKNKKASFHGHLLSEALSGVDPFPFVMAYFDIISHAQDAYDDQQFQLMLNEMNNKLNGLVKEDSTLLVDIADLSNLMNYNTTEIINQINNTAANGYIAEIMTAMGNGDQMGLRWFCQAGANYTNHVPGYDSVYMANYIAPNAQAFYNYYYNSSSLETAFNGISNLIGSPTLSGDSSSLMTFSRLLIGQFGSRNQGTSNSIMNTYMFLEYYYLALFNYQLQAATIWMNVLKANAADTNEANNWWSTTGMPRILNGAQMFLNATDYLVGNLAEYRNQSRWSGDMQYSGLWMAPNTELFNTLARAQFQVKLISLGFNAEAPVIYGTIMTPQNYCTASPRVQVGPGLYNIALTANAYQSRIPYPSWTGNTCTPHNYWSFYNFGFGSNLGCQPWNVNIIPTWPHSSPGNGYGTITPLWFNPRDPDQTSVIKTDSCTVQFAFFCLSWQWGVMLTDYLKAYEGCQLNNNLYIDGMSGYGSNHCATCGESGGNPTTAPFIAQWHSSQHTFEHVQNDATRTFNNNAFGQQSPFKYHLSVSVQPYSGGEMFVADQIAAPVINLPDSLSNGTVELWANYSSSFQINWTNVTWGNFSIGSALVDGTPNCQSHGCNNSQPDVYGSNSDMLNFGGSSSTSGLPNTSGFLWKQVNRGTHQPNFQYNFRIESLNNATQLDAYTWIDMQVIFRGYFAY